MALVYAFGAGVICGAGIMIFVYRNNIKKLTALADEAVAKYKKLEAAVKQRAGK